MPSSPLERLSLLLVEDNVYVRDILESCLRHMGFGRITLARNGEEAVDYLTLVRNAPMRAGIMSVDLVLSDMVMSPINGLLLLKWIRQERLSPNRFLPFVMVSGAADPPAVAAARDMGVSEFLAKPFSVNSIYAKLQRVIDHPRPFVCTQSYFGPDRRRRSMGPPPGAADRRRHGTDHLTQVYGPRDVRRPAAAGDAWMFHLPNTLKDKMGGGRGLFQLPDDLLHQAEEQLERQSVTFHQWAGGYVRRLSDSLENARLTPARRRHEFQEIRLIAHELRGQGGTFGYPLITILARSLYEATHPGCPEDDTQLDLVKAHLDAIRAVVRERVAGDGGRLGQELMQAFSHAVTRVQGHP